MGSGELSLLGICVRMKGTQLIQSALTKEEGAKQQ